MEILTSVKRLYIRFKSPVNDFVYSFGRAALLLLVEVQNHTGVNSDVQTFREPVSQSVPLGVEFFDQKKPYCKQFCEECHLHAQLLLEYHIVIYINTDIHIFRSVRKISKSYYLLRHVCLSVCPHGSTHLHLEGFSRNFMFEYFSKMSREFKFY